MEETRESKRRQMDEKRALLEKKRKKTDPKQPGKEQSRKEQPRLERNKCLDMVDDTETALLARHQDYHTELKNEIRELEEQTAALDEQETRFIEEQERGLFEDIAKHYRAHPTNNLDTHHWSVGVSKDLDEAMKLLERAIDIVEKTTM
jgi:hypothetical protein